ncbi:MAG: RNA polymerase sigma factor [Pseudomonadota bacterium]|nr:RNA polymerase sigma factor [Pseudomonadota bacterium]
MKNIVSLLRRGPGHSFESLLRPHLRDMYRVAYRFTGNRDDAEDLVQDVLTKLYPREQELAGVEHLKPWLARVLYRQFVDNRRRHARTPFAAQQNPPAADNDEPDPITALPGNLPGPDAGVEQHLLQQRLHQALDHLSEDHRSVLTLHDMEGYTLKELETTLDTPLGTLKSRLHRARQQLRLELSTKMEPFSGFHRVNPRGQGK